MTVPPAKPQLDLFEHVENAFKANPNRPLSNDELYHIVGRTAEIPDHVMNARSPIGAAGDLHSTTRRSIRWQQQSLKALGVVERVEGARGLWQLTEKAKKGLNKPSPGVTLLGFSTNLGLALWGTSPDALAGLYEPIELVLTSPPFPLRISRAYGNPTASEFVDFICQVLEPIVPKISATGSLVLNMTNDSFLEKSPGRSTYLERTIIALEDRLGLTLMDRVPWINLSKAPGPMQWSSRTRQQLNVSWEPCLWFARDPILCKADNRRVLRPHTERHAKLLSQGGEHRSTSYGDRAYRVRPGSFGGITNGAIPKNTLQIGHSCARGREHRKALTSLGLTQHGAGWPFAVPDFFIKFLTEPGDLVADIFSGRAMTGRAAEENQRRWICVESALQYVRGAAELFRSFQGFWINPALEEAFGTSDA